MRRIALFLLLLAALSQAQPAAAGKSGDIRGRLVDGRTGASRARVAMILVAAGGSGQDTVRTRTDSLGRFRFHDLQGGEDAGYVVIARYSGGLFAKGPLSPSADRESEDLNVQVWETTTDPAAITVKRDAIFVVPSQGQVGVLESITVENLSERAYIGRRAKEERTGWMNPTFGVGLPARADARSVQVLESSIPILNVVPTDFGVGVTSAIPPGETRITFAYRLPGLVGSYDLSRTALYGMREISVYAADPFTMSSNRLVRSKTQRIGGETYRVWSSNDSIEAGDPVQIMATAEAGAGPAAVGGVVGGALIAALGLFAGVRLLLRRRRGGGEQGSSGDSSERSSSTREDLVAAIAQLDLRYHSGKIAEVDWRAQRAELKSHLSAT